ncbi:MAG: hypothetical protein WD552_00525 [Candidatus Paceibacterota bacterium]
MNKKNGTQTLTGNGYKEAKKLELPFVAAIEDFATKMDPCFLEIYNKKLSVTQKTDIKSLLKTARTHSIAELEEAVEMPIYKATLAALAEGLGESLSNAKEFLVIYGRIFRVRQFTSVDTLWAEQNS